MSIAKKAEIKDQKVKCMIWGEAGSGKSRFALSAPKPLVIDLENSTGWYADQFDFLVAKKDESSDLTKNATVLTKSIIDEIISGEYPDIETLVIDPITDLLDNIEYLCTIQYEKMVLKGRKQVIELNAIEKSKFYAFRRDKTRELLDRILNLDLNIIFIARSKNIWTKTSEGMKPTGKTFDGIDLIEYLPDIVINLRNENGETIADIKKSRIGKIEETIKIKDFNSLIEEIKPKKAKLKAV